MYITFKRLWETMFANVFGNFMHRQCFVAVCRNIALQEPSHLQAEVKNTMHRPAKVQKAVGPAAWTSPISNTIKYSELQYSEVLSV